MVSAVRVPFAIVQFFVVMGFRKVVANVKGNAQFTIKLA